ncbi:tetratricopeptide repeat protein [Agromyces italicus]|uniref:tetratricopeptide repeat protein n=1 Tax=Agromyces italicus TaxID=279572 RepID=UPI0003B7761F|nr:tetratricopeptide repeat protein [Agromyces italicus]
MPAPVDEETGSTDRLPADPSRHRGGEQQLIDRLWDFADPGASAERFRELASDASQTAHTRAVMQTQLARAIGLLGRRDEALAELDDVVGALPVDDDEPGALLAELRARVAIERGRLLAADGRPADAVPELTRGVREAAIAGSTFLVLDALHMLALHDVGHEEEWATEGFDVLDGARDPRVLRWGVALHNNLGWTLHDSGRLTGALMQFEEAARAAEAYGTAEQRHVARWSVARCLRSLGRTDEALGLQRALAAERPDDPYVQAELAALTEAPPTIEA